MRNGSILIASVCLLLTQPGLLAQEATPAAEEVAPSEATEGDAEEEVVEELVEEAGDDDLDDADLDLQTYEQDDDDFVPTEEVPADQAIPFPTDI